MCALSSKLREKSFRGQFFPGKCRYKVSPEPKDAPYQETRNLAIDYSSWAGASSLEAIFWRPFVWRHVEACTKFISILVIRRHCTYLYAKAKDDSHPIYPLTLTQSIAVEVQAVPPVAPNIAMGIEYQVGEAAMWFGFL